MKVDKYNNFTFKSGLTKKMQSEIRFCSPKRIENYLADKKIEADFKDNKVVAWCSLKCIQIVDTLNKKFGLNLCFPNGIFVEDFRNLNGANVNALGLTNFAPSYLYKSKNIIVPEKTVYFNKHDINWQAIDQIGDITYENGISVTNFFIENILHEFMHVLHENNLLKKLDGNILVNMLQALQDKEVLKEFQKKYAKSLSDNICQYAASNPFEAVACDLAGKEVHALDKETLLPKTNIFNKKPYNNRYFLSKDKDSKYEKLLRNFWNGKFLV